MKLRISVKGPTLSGPFSIWAKRARQNPVEVGRIKMKVAKTISAKALAANRKNAQKSQMQADHEVLFVLLCG